LLSHYSKRRDDLQP